eukprot:8083822-Pyramimonas_sp.AAC.2
MSNGGEVLPGPRTPFWSCGGCGLSATWASRAQCRRGRPAPARIAKAARVQAEEAASTPTPGGQRHQEERGLTTVSYTHLRAHETGAYL